MIFIDDRIENVKAAKIQGINAIHFINPKQLKEELEKRGFDLAGKAKTTCNKVINDILAILKSCIGA